MRLLATKNAKPKVKISPATRAAVFAIFQGFVCCPFKQKKPNKAQYRAIMSRQSSAPATRRDSCSLNLLRLLEDSSAVVPRLSLVVDLVLDVSEMVLDVPEVLEVSDPVKPVEVLDIFDLLLEVSDALVVWLSVLPLFTLELASLVAEEALSGLEEALIRSSSVAPWPVPFAGR